MGIIESIILGVVQGITEFIPVSSSGHLSIAGALLDLEDAFEFDVLLNIGTLAALVYHTRTQLLQLVRQFLGGQRQTGYKLIAATLPAAVAGLVFSDRIESVNDNTQLVLVMLALVGAAMVLVKPKKSPLKDMEDINWRIVGFIGFAQVLALVPGTSRSGITILAGLYIGLSRGLSAQWSFLMAIPIIAGATAKILLSPDGLELVSGNMAEVIVGNIASFVVGLLAIGFLLRILGSNTLKPFGYYRIGLTAVLAVLLAVDVI